MNTINYYGEVIAKMGPTNSAKSFTRLYMVPGMQHCGGGPARTISGSIGATLASDPQHNIRVALENWVEKGTAPGTLLRANMRGTLRKEQCDDDAPSVPLSAVCEVQGQRGYEQRRKLRLRSSGK